MNGNNFKSDGVLLGVRLLDLFFVPKLKITDNGIELYKTEEFVNWNQIKKIRQFDNTFWRMMRNPMTPGTYIEFNDNKRFWLSARLITKDKSFRDIVSNWSKYQTDDYLWALSRIKEHTDIEDESRCDPLLNNTARIVRGLLITAVIIIILWIVANIVSLL